MSEEGSKATVLLAGAANLAIALAKLAAGLMTGSSAMLSEAAHSFADTLNQAFLMAALHRSRRPPDSDHPFGYGMERYFWSLLAAVSIFVLGAGFSIHQGVSALLHPPPRTSLAPAFVVLAIALVFEGVSLTRALIEVRRGAQAAQRSTGRHLLQSDEPTVRAVVFEDGAAVIGIVLAAAGLFLDEARDTRVFDAAASIVIGVLLVGVAWALGRQNLGFLIGRSVDREVLSQMRAEIEAADGIERVVDLRTMRLGPDEVLLAARVEVDPGASGRHLEEVADEVDRRLQDRFDDVVHVFLDPTPQPVTAAPRGRP